MVEFDKDPLTEVDASGDSGKAEEKSDGYLRLAMKVILPVSVFGSLGGLVRALGSQNSYQLRLPFFPDTCIELGFVGDAYVGAMTSVAAFILVGALFGLLKARYSSFAEWCRIISISVIAGYVGTDLLDSLSSDLVGRIDLLKQDVREDLETFRFQVMANAEIDEAVAKLEQATATRKGTDESRFDEAEQIYMQALARINRAIEYDPSSKKAFVEKAKIFSGLARSYDGMGKQEGFRENLESAISTLDEAIKLDANFPRAFYNRSCYHALLGNKKDALEDLGKAISLDPLYKKLAKTDGDFKNVSNASGFLRLIGS